MKLYVAVRSSERLKVKTTIGKVRLKKLRIVVSFAFGREFGKWRLSDDDE